MSASSYQGTQKQETPSMARRHEAQSARDRMRQSPAMVLQRAYADLGTLTPADVKVLQRSIGNNATAQLLRPELQRKELTLGPVDDPYEQEADRGAEQAVRQLDSKPVAAPRPQVQRDDLEEDELVQTKLVTDYLAPVRQAPVKRAFVARRDEEARPMHGPAGGAVAKGVQQEVVQRAVGFEFEDPTWTVFMQQPGRQFRNPTGFGSLFSSGHIATPGTEKSDEERAVEKYTGENVFQAGAGSDTQHINNKVGKFNLQTGPKKGTLHTGVDYNIEPDGPYNENGVTNRMDLEIVTEPFPETKNGFGKLLAALDDIQSVFNRLTAKASGEYRGGEFEYSRFVGPSQHGFRGEVPNVYLYGGKAGGAFKPQVTAGVDLSDLPEVMETLGGSVPDESHEDYTRRAPVRKMVHGREDPPSKTAKTIGVAPSLADIVIKQLQDDDILDETMDTAELRGFLALTLAIIQEMQAGIGAREGIKTRMPLLSRYSLAAVFRQVPEPIQVALKDELASSSLLRGISKALRGTDVRGTMDDPMITTGTIYKAGTATPVQPLMDLLRSFTRKEWLLNILDGRDLLTPDDLLGYLRREDSSDTQKAGADKYDKSIAVYLRGYGNTSNVREVEGEESGSLALLENRSVTPWEGTGADPGMSLKEARQFAIDYFSWLMTIKQARDKAKRRKEEEKRQKEQEELEAFESMIGAPPVTSPLRLALQEGAEFPF